MSSLYIPIPITPTGGPNPPLATFQVAGVFELMATNYGVNLFCEGMDADECFGLIYASDSSLLSLLQQHSVPYNYQIIDGDPAWLVRRAIGDDLAIDDTIMQTDCVPLQKGGPAFGLVHTDIMALPRTVEISYIDPDRDYNVNTASYTRPGAPATGGKLSLSVATVISADQARAMAVDVMWRQWAQVNVITLQHPNLRYQPSDILALATKGGLQYVGLVTKSVITPDRNNQIELKTFLTRGGGALAAGGISGGGSGSSSGGVAGADFGAWLFTGA